MPKFNPVERLQDYVESALLPNASMHPSAPPMPPAGHRSHLNHIQVIPNPYRTLETIKKLNPSNLMKRLQEWTTRVIPNHDFGGSVFDAATHESLTIPGTKSSRTPEYPHLTSLGGKPENLEAIRNITRTYALTTVSHVIRLVDDFEGRSRESEWGFHTMDPDNYEYNLFRHIVWAPKPREIPYDPETRSRQVVVALQAPWILSDQDITDFAAVKTFPPYNDMKPDVPLFSGHRVWARMWDLCIHYGTTWFVVTSYNKWVFGRFSKHRSIAHITQVFESSSDSPTIIQLLTFWIKMAMAEDVSSQEAAEAVFPQVIEPLFNADGLPTNYYEVVTRPPKKVTFPPSLTIVDDGDMDDIASSAGVTSVTDYYSDYGSETIPLPLARVEPEQTRQKIDRWISKVLLGNPDDINPSAPSTPPHIPYDDEEGEGEATPPASPRMRNTRVFTTQDNGYMINAGQWMVPG